MDNAQKTNDSKYTVVGGNREGMTRIIGKFKTKAEADKLVKQIKNDVKTRSNVAKQANEIMLRGFKAMQKEIDALLKKNGLWYCDSDIIRYNPELHVKNDRNADQMIKDHIAVIKEDVFNHVIPEHLWDEESIKEPKKI